MDNEAEAQQNGAMMPAGFGLLGLHRLIAGRGDKLVPELYEAMQREAEWRRDHPNVVHFPVWAMANRSAAEGAAGDGGAADQGKVLAFAPPVVEKRSERKSR